MRRLFLSALTVAVLTGCGGSGNVVGNPTEAFNFDGRGNFISTSVEVEQRYLYLLNRQENTVSAYILPEEEGEGHGHDHSHERFLAQEHDNDEDDEHEEEEGPEFQELDPSPFDLGTTPIVSIAVAGEGKFLVVLDQTGLVRTFLIDAITGLLSFQSERASNVSNPRRLVVDHSSVAILGDQLSIHEVDSEGVLSAPAFLDGTSDWTDVVISHDTGVGSTSNGAAGFAWSPSNSISPVFEIALPGATRGELCYAGEAVYVVNAADNSLSRLSQEESGEITLVDSFELPAELSNPTLIVSIFEGEDLMVADADSVSLLHPEEDDIEDEGSVELDRQPNSLFAVPESEAVLVGHDIGEGSSILLVEEDGPELLDHSGPGHEGVSSFGYAERVDIVTVTSEL